MHVCYRCVFCTHTHVRLGPFGSRLDMMHTASMQKPADISERCRKGAAVRRQSPPGDGAKRWCQAMVPQMAPRWPLSCCSVEGRPQLALRWPPFGSVQALSGAWRVLQRGTDAPEVGMGRLVDPETPAWRCSSFGGREECPQTHDCWINNGLARQTSCAREVLARCDSGA